MFPFAGWEIEALPEKDTAVILLLFGVKGRFNPGGGRFSVRKVSELLGSTPFRVTRIRDNALMQLAQNRISRLKKK
jgi:hypothetical protein